METDIKTDRCIGVLLKLDIDAILRSIAFANENAASSIVEEVVVHLDDEEREFTFDDFKKRLGF